MRFVDRTGIKYNRLTAVSVYSRTKSAGYYWNCVCECGNTTVVHGGSLTTGNVKSCGCWNMEALLSRITTHGESKAGYETKECKTWSQIKQRCYNKNTPGYKYYGGRGITVCDRWLESYENFLADMGRAPSREMSIDRIDNNGNYEPSNCRWATRKEQSLNKTTTLRIEYEGQIVPVREVAKKLNVCYRTLLPKVKNKSSNRA